MEVRPILFNTEMVQAILAGHKRVTRRTIKPQPTEHLTCGEHWRELLAAAAAPFHPGDVLWVRETWCRLARVDENCTTHYDDCNYYYATDGDYQIDLYDDDGFLLDDQRMKWRPSIHMPKEAARLFLRVTDIRVEQLQDMYVDDALSEGAWGNDIPSIPFSLLFKEHPTASCNAIASFAHLWDSTIKPSDLTVYGWSTNPWVWVIAFERCEKPAVWPESRAGIKT